MRSVSRSLLALAAVVAGGFIASPSQAQTTVGSPTLSGLSDTRVQNDGNRTLLVQPGQTFRTPNDVSTSLTSWTVWASNFYAAYYPTMYPGSFVTLPFALAIYEWNGAAPIGDALFTSATVVPTTDDYAASPVTFSVGQALDPTKTYLALITAADLDQPVGPNFMSGVKNSCNLGCGGYDPYADGGYVRIESIFDDRGNLTSQSVLTQWQQSHDMAFSATFDTPVSAFNTPVTATPEPASMTLIATGMAGLAGYARRRRKAK